MLDSIAGGLVAGAFNLIGGKMRNDAAANAADKANDFSAAQTAQQMDFQREQAAISRDFNANQAIQAADWTNRAQDKAMQFNREEADRQRGWSEALSNSAYSRAMADMRHAGLNPILAYSQGGASSPGGASASIGSGGFSGGSSSAPSGSAATGQKADVENIVSPAVASAMQASQLVLGLRQLEANIDRTKAETSRIGADEDLLRKRTGLTMRESTTEGERPPLVTAHTAESRARSRLLGAETATELERPGLVAAQRGLSSAQATGQEFENRRWERWGPRTQEGDRLASLEVAATRAIVNTGATPEARRAAIVSFLREAGENHPLSQGFRAVLDALGRTGRSNVPAPSNPLE